MALLVDGVTKFDKAFYGDDAEAETIRKMIVAAGQDVRVLVIKLADRLHNMRTLDARSPASRARIARATQDVLVPLCDRLGIQALKRELEDTVLCALEPEALRASLEHVGRRTVRAGRPTLDAFMAQHRRDAAAGRRSAPRWWPGRGTYYSIWKDTVAEGHDVPHDLPRIVIIVRRAARPTATPRSARCTATWRPVPGRFKDFIASPKNNLYRSLHTTVLGPDDRPVEVLIRTEPMHRAAEYGIADELPLPRADRPAASRDAVARATGLAGPGARLAGGGRDAARSWTRCAATCPRGRSSSSRATASGSSCRPAARRSTWRTPWACRPGTDASGRTSPAGWYRCPRFCTTET